MIHTIKGVCGFLGLTRLEEMSHATENVFGALRDGRLTPTRDLIAVIFRGVDEIKNTLTQLEANQSEPEHDIANLLSALDAMASSDVPTERSSTIPSIPQINVVKTQIEKIGGTVDLQTSKDKGTTVRIKIPLTLAIISSLVVRGGGECFAIPQLGVVELVRLVPEERHRIERIHTNEVFRLRNRLLPVLRLNRVVDMERPAADDADINIVVLQVGDQQFGLIVDEVFDTEEIVVKPVGSLLKEIAIYQGTTILGDGRVILILDVGGIANEAGLAQIASSMAVEQSRTDDDGEIMSLLFFNVGNGRSMSVPLSLVSRLDEIPTSRIELAGDRDVVQYRGDLLPLLPVHGYSREGQTREVQPIVVFCENGHSMGLMVSEIEDIVEERLTMRLPSQREGVLGTAIIHERATEILDTHYYAKLAHPNWYRQDGRGSANRVLLAEDSVFFRQLITTHLTTEGFQVTATADGRQALGLLEQGAEFDLIVTDIEMPELNGFELAQAVRANPASRHLPIVALTANTSASIQQRAQEIGFDSFLHKFDPGQLNAGIQAALKKRVTSKSA